jgi:hypothetical protein
MSTFLVPKFAEVSWRAAPRKGNAVKDFFTQKIGVSVD